MESNVNKIALAMRPLRLLLLFDSVLLFLLGGSLMVLPERVEAAFNFTGLPHGVGYMLGLWGCGLLTMACGYFVAALDPLRNLIWVQIGIARGLLECVLGLYYAGTGVISFRQGAFGMITAGLIAIGYIVLYPRQQSVLDQAFLNSPPPPKPVT
jgi:hypothetical protein